MNSVTLCGTVGHLRSGVSQNNNSWANFTVKSERRFSARSGELKTFKVFVRVSMFGSDVDLAMHDGIADGSVVLVQGYLSSSKDQNGEWKLEVRAQQVAVLSGGDYPEVQTGGGGSEPLAEPSAPPLEDIPF